MSVILPPNNGGYPTYRGSIDDLEDELRADADRARERAESDVERIRQRHENDLRKLSRESESALREANESSGDTLTRERALSREQMEELRRNTYDRWGRTQSAENQILKQKLDDAQRGLEEEQYYNNLRFRDLNKAYERQTEDREARHNRATERYISENNNRLNSSYSDMVRAQKEADSARRAQLEKHYRELVQKTSEEMRDTQVRTNQALQNSEFDHQRQMERNRTAEAKQLKAHQASLELEAQRRLQDAQAQYKDQAALRSRLNEMADYGRRLASEQAGGREAAIREMEDNWRALSLRAQQSYEAEIDHTKEASKDVERYLLRQNDINMKDKDSLYSEVLRRKTAENQNNKKTLEELFDTNRKQLEKRNQLDRQEASARISDLISSTTAEREEALFNQAKQYQRSMEHGESIARAKINQLERERAERFGSTDTADIPPAATHALEKRFLEEYQSKLDTEQTRNRQSESSIQQEYAVRMRDALVQKDSLNATLNQGINSRHYMEKTDLLNHIRDVELLKQASLADQEVAQEREVNAMRRGFQETLEKQRRSFDELLQAQRYDAESRIVAIRQESDFNARMAQRAFSQKQNELIREYEKKLADQKVDYSTLIEQTKADADQKLREGERRNRVALEEQARAYEQRLAQLDVQFKERERNMAQNHEEALDKIRRSHALLQKKG